jgi:hypothetical protein
MPEAFFGLTQLVIQVGDALATLVLQLHPFQIVPDSLRWVQLWGIAGELLQMNPLGRPSAQVLLHCLAAVDGSPIPGNQQLPRDMPQQVPKEPDYILPAVGSLLYHQVQLAFRGDASHNRKMFSAQRSTNNGSLAHWGVGSYHPRQQVETGLVHEH